MRVITANCRSPRVTTPRAAAASLLVTLTAMSFLFPSAGEASTISVAPHRSAIAGPAAVREFSIDPDTLAALRREEVDPVIDHFALGGEEVSLELQRITVIDRSTRIEEMATVGTRVVTVPDESYFTGRVRGDAGSRVVLVAAAEGVRGFVIKGGRVFVFGKDPVGRHHVLPLPDSAASESPGRTFHCDNDLHPELARAAMAGALPGTALPRDAVAPGTVLELKVAIDTDNEFLAKFPSASAATSYLALLVAATNAIYQDELGVRLRVTYIRVWATPDPWNSGDPSEALDEVQTFWLNPVNGMDAKAGVRNVVGFVSGKAIFGGIAYLAGACDSGYGFAVSQVSGGFSVSDPDAIWDILVFAHEIGHTLGSPHTHCYTPPIDLCFSGEPGCYAGTTSLPVEGGTIMSYCQLQPGGVANIHLTFGPVVESTIRQYVSTLACLDVAAVCGDGALGAGETCDDGNRAGGDGCSAICQAESCGNGVLDVGEQCDDGNPQPEDGCSNECIRQPRCGDGIRDSGEGCDDGNTQGDDGCSSTCVYEPLCGDGIRDPDEACDQEHPPVLNESPCYAATYVFDSLPLSPGVPARKSFLVWDQRGGAILEGGRPGQAQPDNIRVTRKGRRSVVKATWTACSQGGTAASAKLTFTKGCRKIKGRLRVGRVKRKLRARALPACDASAPGFMANVQAAIAVEMSGDGTEWHEPAAFARLIGRTEVRLGCALHSYVDQEGPGDRPGGRLPGYDWRAQYCGPSNRSGEMALYLTWPSCVNDGCYVHDECYALACLTGGICSFDPAIPPAGDECDQQLVAECRDVGVCARYAGPLAAAYLKNTAVICGYILARKAVVIDGCDQEPCASEQGCDPLTGECVDKSTATTSVTSTSSTVPDTTSTTSTTDTLTTSTGASSSSILVTTTSLVTTTTAPNCGTLAPMVNGLPVDQCLTYGSTCGGQGAANAFCASIGCGAATTYSSGFAPRSFVIGDGQVCDAGWCVPGCLGCGVLTSVTCAR